jgi:hypothetical protein
MRGSCNTYSTSRTPCAPHGDKHPQRIRDPASRSSGYLCERITFPVVVDWFEVVSVTQAGVEVDDNNGRCYSVTVPT